MSAEHVPSSSGRRSPSACRGPPMASLSLTPEASLSFILTARKTHTQPMDKDDTKLPALSKLLHENRKSHASAMEYWCDSGTSLFVSKKHSDSTTFAQETERWPFEADAAAAEDADRLCSRVTSRCISSRRESATAMFDAAVLALVKTSVYASTATTLLAGEAGVELGDSPVSDTTLSSPSQDDEDGELQHAQQSDLVRIPLSPDEAVKRYHDCCRILDAVPHATVVARLSRPASSSIRNAPWKLESPKGVSMHAPLSASVQSNSVMSASGLTDPSASASIAMDTSLTAGGVNTASHVVTTKAHQLPGVSYVAVCPTVGHQSALTVRGVSGSSVDQSSSPIGMESDQSDMADTLNVSHSPHLGEPKSFIPFLGFLHGLTYLRRINLSRIDLQNSCFSVFLLLCTAYLPSIEDVDVSYNARVSDGCAADVFRFVRETSSLRRFCVKGTAMRPTTISRIEWHVKRHSTPILHETEMMPPRSKSDHAVSS